MPTAKGEAMQESSGIQTEAQAWADAHAEALTQEMYGEGQPVYVVEVVRQALEDAYERWGGDTDEAAAEVYSDMVPEDA